MLSKMRSNEDRQSDSEESEEESQDKTNSSVPPIPSSANSLSGAFVGVKAARWSG